MKTMVLVKSFVVSRWIRKFNTNNQLRSYQERKLIEHIANLRSKSKYFSKFAVVKTIDDLQCLPLMNKQIMMENFNEINTVGLDAQIAIDMAIRSEKSRDFTPKYNGVSVGLSSGTSGHRGIFIANDQERQMWAGTIIAKMLPPNKFFGQRIALFLRADNNLYQTVKSKILAFQYFDIYRSMDKNISELARYQPTILVAPPSVLIIIAEHLNAGKLELNNLQRVISVAEVLSESDEIFFKKAFNQHIIFQIYQCTEGFLAFTCVHGSLHLNEEIIFFEREKISKNRFIPIISDLYRTSQPIVRYRLNDVLVASNKQCKCKLGTATIKRIEGREDDIFILKNTTGKNILVFADMISRCMLYTSNLNDYRVVQTSYSHFDIYIDSLDLATMQHIKKELGELAYKVGFNLPTITFRQYSRNMSKKLKRIERKFKA